MDEAAGKKPTPKPGQLIREKGRTPPVSVTPSDRLESRTVEYIEALERDKKRLQSEIVRLQARIDQLAPENARLDVALTYAESNRVAATILIGVGGFLVSYATFTGNSASTWANVAAGCLLAGVILLIWQSIQGRRRRPGHP